MTKIHVPPAVHSKWWECLILQTQPLNQPSRMGRVVSHLQDRPSCCLRYTEYPLRPCHLVLYSPLHAISSSLYQINIQSAPCLGGDLPPPSLSANSIHSTSCFSHLKAVDAKSKKSRHCSTENYRQSSRGSV